MLETTEVQYSKLETRYSIEHNTLRIYGRVVECWTWDHEVTGSNLTRGCCVPTPTQRLSHRYQRKLEE